jgi:hypothetical protein
MTVLERFLCEVAAVDEELRNVIYPITELPEEIPSPVAPCFDAPEKIIQDILKAEKDLADETMNTMRARHERERAGWERLYEQKERDMLALKSRLAAAEDRIKKLMDQANEGRQVQLEQIRMNAREMEMKRLSDMKKWETIADEVRSFREIAQAAEKKLQSEQEQLRQLKKHLAAQETIGKGELNVKEDELMELKEQRLKVEEALLKSQSESGEKITTLQEQVKDFEKTLAEERQLNTQINEKKDGDLSRLQKGIQDAVIQINLERQKKEESNEKIIELQKRLQDTEDGLRKTQQANEAELLTWKKSWQDEQSAWEKNKQEFVAKEESLRKDLEEQLKRVTKTLNIAEQQLAEEQRVRRSHEEALQQKDQEIQRVLADKDETVKGWRGILDTEGESGKKRLADVQAEFDHVRQLGETEIASLHAEMKKLSAAFEEEKRLLGEEKDENEKNRIKMQHLEDDRRRLTENLENKEKDWQAVLLREQELLQKQIEELRAKNEAQIQSREMEITRLNEDLNILNGQMHELRQKFSLEKNENNNRLTRMQEFEIQMRTLNERHNQERLDGEHKVTQLKEQLEQQRKSALQAQEEIETQAKRDLQLYRDKINKLTVQVSELQKKTDLDRRPVPSVDQPASVGGKQGRVQETPSSPAAGPSSVVRTANRYYPGK